MSLKQPFTGSVALVSGEIAEDITQYLAVSEQTPSSVAMLISLGADEIKEMIIEGQAEVCCHFCSEKYQFSARELTAILQEIG